MTNGRWQVAGAGGGVLHGQDRCLAAVSGGTPRAECIFTPGHPQRNVVVCTGRNQDGLMVQMVVRLEVLSQDRLQ